MRYIVVCLVAILVTTGVSAQSAERCSAQDIQDRVDALYTDYAADRASEESSAALDSVKGLLTSVQAIHDECTAMLAAEAETETDAPQEPGRGTLTDPFRYGVVGETGGISVQVIETIRPGDAIIRRENSFNDRPEADEVYIIVKMAVACNSRRREGCEFNFLNFKLVGSENIIYDMPFVVFKDQIDLELLPGGEGEGSIPFIVKKSDTNLRLLYYPISYQDDFIALAAEPDPSQGVRITINSNINVRSGPGTTFAAVSRLTNGQSMMAIGRNEDSTWLRIPEGWIATNLVQADGDVTRLKIVDE